MLARLTAAAALSSSLFLWCTALAGAAPTPTPEPSASPKIIDSIIVTALRHSARASAVSRETFVISESDLARFGAQTAADALRFVPGTVVQQYGALGALETAALRGASSAQTLVLIDGRPANEADTGLFDFSSLPVGAIDRIEVVEGGASTLYGSAAVGGVINIITKRAGKNESADAYAQWGYEGSFMRGLGFGGGDEHSLAYRVDAQAESAQDVFTYGAFAAFEPAGVRTNDDAKIQHAGVALVHGFGGVRASVNLDDDTSAIGAPGSVMFASVFARQLRVYQRGSLDLDAPLPLGDVELQLYADTKRLHFFDPNPAFQFDTQDNGVARGGAFRITTAIGRLHELTAGADDRNDTVMFDAAFEGVPYAGPTVVRDSTTAWYVQDEIHVPGAPFSATLGVRREATQGTKSTTVPSVGALEHLAGGVDVIANYARAFHTPTLDDRYFPGFGNPDLQPEYAATFDVGVRRRAASTSLQLNYFGTDTNNLIVNVPIDAFGDLKPFNVNRARLRGGDVHFEAIVGRSGHVLASYTDFFTARDLTLGTRLLYRPTANAGIAAWVQRGAWEYGAQGTFVGKRFADETNTQLLPAYFLTGVHVSRTFGHRVCVTLRGDNLENNHHAEDQLGYPIVGSSISLRIATPY